MILASGVAKPPDSPPSRSALSWKGHRSRRADRTPGRGRAGAGSARWRTRTGRFDSSYASLLLELSIQARQVPDFHRLILTCRNQAPATGAERQAGARSHVTPEGVFAREGLRVPNFHGAILRCRGYPPAIGTEGRRSTLGLAAELPCNGANRLACFSLSKRQLAIDGHGEQTPAVRAVSHAPKSGVSRESQNRLCGPCAQAMPRQPGAGHVPNLDGSVSAGRSEALPVRTERQAPHVAIVFAHQTDRVVA